MFDHKRSLESYVHTTISLDVDMSNGHFIEYFFKTRLKAIVQLSVTQKKQRWTNNK